MKKLLILLAVFTLANCQRNIKYAQNPAEGQAFFVTFQQDKVYGVMSEGQTVAYRGSCTLVSKLAQVVTVMDVRTSGNVGSVKTSLNAGVIMSTGQQSFIENCFEHPAYAPSVFQIVYKVGDTVYTDDIPVSIMR